MKTRKRCTTPDRSVSMIMRKALDYMGQLVKMLSTAPIDTLLQNYNNRNLNEIEETGNLNV